MGNALIFANFLWPYTNYVLCSELQIVNSKIAMRDCRVQYPQKNAEQVKISAPYSHVTPARLGSQEPKVI